jgi:hypothetical protein
MEKLVLTLTGEDLSSSDECPFGSTEEEEKEKVEQDN